MNAFEEMGHSLVLAQEGQRQLAEMVRAWVSASAKRLVKSVGHALSKGRAERRRGLTPPAEAPNWRG